MSSREVTVQDSPIPEGYGEVGTSLAVSLARAEVDQQIATARALPRILSRVVQNIQTLATLDDETAEECIYALPRGGKPIKGPSIRLAEIIGTQWGNARVGARVVHIDRAEKFVEAEGVFHDLETNMATTSRVRRRISDKSGRILTDDMIIVTGNAACSIAKRNAILGGVPKAVWRKAYSAVEQVIAGDVKTLTERREKAMKAFAAFGAKPDQVLAALGLRSAEDITLEHMPILAGMHSALKSGESSVEEMFSRQDIEKREDGPSKPLGDRLSALKDRLPSGDQSSVNAETGEITNSDRGSPAAKGTEAKGDPRHASPGDSVSDLTPRQEGRAAYHGGGTEGDCPAYRNRADRDEWIAGFRDAADENNDSFPGDR